jgi:hypothetical protein
MDLTQSLADIRQRIERAAGGRAIVLVGVSKRQPLAAMQAAHSAGLRVFGENYVQEALGKMHEWRPADTQWHLIGPLQSNKCKEVAGHFDWLQSLDRSALIPRLAKHRPASMPPLNVLLQVNIDDETSKSGCRPDELPALAQAVHSEPRLRLRGLMAIPAPWPDRHRRAQSFGQLKSLFDALAADFPIDTLSMGMSDDFELAIDHGATMVRVGSALFGARA